MFDLAVIGGGPGGYVAAIRASQLGLKTVLIEKSDHLGGTCLNVGCIPSKALLHSTELYHMMEAKAAENGIHVAGLSMDVGGLMKKKNSVVNKLRGGLKQLMAHKKVEVRQGVGLLLGNGRVQVEHQGNSDIIEAKHIVIATGSASIELPFMPFDGQHIVSSDDAIAFDAVPKNFVVVGAGAIGLEMACVWSRLGAKVTVVELLPHIAPTFDIDISKATEKIFRAQGIHFELNAKVTGVKKDKKGQVCALTAIRGEEQLEIAADKILVAVGRRPYTEGLNAAAVGLALDERKRIVVDRHFKTNLSGVYAIGDVVAGPMLAHKAEDEGVAVAELIAGRAGHVNYAAIPNVIYTDPEIASVGLSEAEAIAQGYSVKVGKMPFSSNGRAIACDATDGLVKVIACAQTDKLLGVHMVGHKASEMIAEAVTHLEYGGSSEDLARTTHAHPTLSEVIKEAALAVDKRAIHG